MKKVLFAVLILVLLILIGCKQTIIKYQCSDGSLVDSVDSCSVQASNSKIDCPKLDCSACPVKTETKTIEKKITEKIYVCSDLTEVKNKDDCLKADAEGWYEIKTFSGSSAKTTESFKINSKRWRYILSCRGLDRDYSGYNLGIYKIVNDQPSQIDFEMMSKCDLNEEPNYVYEGEGEYYFDFNPVGIDSWEIKVEEKK